MAVKPTGQCKRTDCLYRLKRTGSCDYISMTQVSRGCSVAECDKYRPEGEDAAQFKRRLGLQRTLHGEVLDANR